MASNHLAFHDAAALQNAQALSGLHYQFTNHKAVVLSTWALAYRVNAEIERTRITPVIHDIAPIEIQLENKVKVKAPIIVDNSAHYGKVEAPVVATNNNSASLAKERIMAARAANAAAKAAAAKPSPKAPSKNNPNKPTYVWKPGHGAIEKVDRRTGEIFHLCEVGYEEQVAA
ncbi:hypothetical protein [Thiofilum flexile]|uniref:hypothetical protein n=1 Tax=Thiofilum flexile TaxID=125627 RepID=UPI00035C3D4A|nr:hypothetical protein [Thiofilum flexile]